MSKSKKGQKKAKVRGDPKCGDRLVHQLLRRLARHLSVFVVLWLLLLLQNVTNMLAKALGHGYGFVLHL